MSQQTAELETPAVFPSPMAGWRMTQQAIIDRLNDATLPAVWPTEAQMIVTALAAARADAKCVADHRALARASLRAVGLLKLFSDALDADGHLLYTRDIAPRGLGFITQRRLPLGYGGVLRLQTPQGDNAIIGCTIYRCRPTVEGWFEGALCFNREQRFPASRR